MMYTLNIYEVDCVCIAGREETGLDAQCKGVWGGRALMTLDT